MTNDVLLPRQIIQNEFYNMPWGGLHVERKKVAESREKNKTTYFR
jgi:hypothetical protein